LVLAVALLATACGDAGAALSGVAPGLLLTPTPFPSPTPYDCGQLPSPKCDVMRRVEEERREATERWRAQADRSYVPIPGIAFVDSSPRPTLPPTTPSPEPEPALRPCAATDLAGALGGTNGAGGISMWAVNIANRSESPCGLKGRPGIRILARASLAPASYADADPNAGHLVVLTPGTGAPDSQHAVLGQAWTWVLWSRACTAVWSGASTLVLDLPVGGGALAIALPATASPPPTPVPSAECPADAPYLPSVGAWEFQSRVSPAADSVSVPVITASANVPGFAVAGEILTFQVTLTNPSVDAIRFGECPNFRMWISTGTDGGVVTERHQLNCAVAPGLAPYSSRTFEMRIPVPADWPVTRDGGFGWGLEGYAGVAIKLPLIIARRG
jgi:uncharacterized protein DUF4232